MIADVSRFFAVLFLFLPLSLPASNFPKQGPKARVAVAQFGTTDRFASVYGGWNIGGGLAAQLVTSLIDSRRVVVVERAILSRVLMEQELGQANLSSPFTQIPAGHLLGVDYLIVGEVTEFEEKQMGGGGGLSIMKGFGPKISSDMVAAHVGIDLRVIDTRTGEILHSHRAQGRAWEKAFGAKINYKFIEFGGDLFHKTPLGKATRRAIENALLFILEVIEKRTADFSWMARVIEVEENRVYFDAGSEQKIREGDRFRVSTVQKVLTDPETNEVLGLLEKEMGKIVAIQALPKFTKARIVGSFRPKIGDLVRLEGDSQYDSGDLHPEGYQILD
ncbi:MAG: hypothetical protein HYW02_06420 [Deltaproteobacteria bacterium]|nr:hypothetical protein [Deltaproteobacteria bacterium]MBI2501085.1 hypothetical protein [Deltaproteobacteria bacterium]